MFEEFIHRLKSDAKNGNIEAKYQLGSTYHWGYKVARDSNQAIYWYSRAIEEGHVKALVNLGYIYIVEGVPQNIIKGIELWKEAARAKDVKALYNLGICYRNPLKFNLNENLHNSRADDKLIIKWFREAAEQGDVDSQGELGIFLYENDIDRNEGLHWIRLAATQGMDIYQYYLATIELSSGNIDEAISWYQQTSWRGAKYNLGLIYLLGLSNTGINHELAYKYLIEEEDVPPCDPHWGYQYYNFPYKFNMYKRKNGKNTDELTLFKKFCEEKKFKYIYPNTSLNNVHNDLLKCYLNEFYLEDTKLILNTSASLRPHEEIEPLKEKHILKDCLIKLSQPELEQIKEALSNYSIALKKYYSDIEDINMFSFAGSTRVIDSVQEYFDYVLEKKYQYYMNTITGETNPVSIRKDEKGILDFVPGCAPLWTAQEIDEFHAFEEEHIFIRVDATRYYYYHNPKYWYRIPCDFRPRYKEYTTNSLPDNLRIRLQGVPYYDEGQESYLQSLMIDELFSTFGYKFIEKKREESLRTKHVFYHQNEGLIVYHRCEDWCVIEEYTGNTSISIYKITLSHPIDFTKKFVYNLSDIAETRNREKIKSNLSLIDLVQIGFDTLEPDKNIKEASEEYMLVELQKKAETGDIQAQYTLAQALDKAGKSFERECFKWYKIAALKGYPPAQNNLGYCYSHGYGIKKNKRIATRWFKIAADNGEPRAKRTFALHLLKGIGTQQNIPEAMKLLEKFSMEGNRDAQSALSWVYYNGVYVDENNELALKWHKEAAKQGEMYAQFRLGYTYEKGHGVNINFKEAMKWYKKAAKQGLATAQYQLGNMFEQGLGVLPDKRKALQWYSLAAIQQDEESTLAKEKVDELKQYFPKKTIVLKLIPKMEAWNKKHNVINNWKWSIMENFVQENSPLTCHMIYHFYDFLDKLKKNGFTLN